MNWKDQGMFCSECGLVVEPGPFDTRKALAEIKPATNKVGKDRPGGKRLAEPTPHFIEVSSDGFCIDAEFLAEGLRIEPSAVHTMMKFGEITSVCEKGHGEDAGLHRLTFCHGDRRVQLVLGSNGEVLENLH